MEARRQGIRPEQGRRAVLLKAGPAGVIAEQIQQMRQMIVAGIFPPGLRRKATADCQAMVFQPGFELVEPMIAFGQNIGQPKHAQLTGRQAPPVAVGRKVLVQQGVQLHVAHLGDQQGNIVNAFRSNRSVFGHSPIVPQSRFPIWKMSERSAIFLCDQGGRDLQSSLCSGARIPDG